MSGRIIDSFPQTKQLSVRKVRLGLRAHIFSGGTPDKSNLNFWTDGVLPWIGSGEVNQRHITTPTAYITSDAVRASATKLFPAGAVAMALAGQGKTKAMAATMGIDTYGNQSLACIADYKGDSRFLFWWLTSLYREIRGLSSQDTRDGLNQAMIGQIPVPVFDSHTQKTIADFLDRETTRIDQLIEKKRRLIEVLEEKVAASISSGIRGWLTSPDSDYKADIEWLDSYPGHWKRISLKSLGHGKDAIFIDGDWIESKDLNDNGIRYLTTGNVGQGYYKEQGAGFISKEMFQKNHCTEVKSGDILISRLNMPIGRACIIPDLGYQIVTSVDNVIVRPTNIYDREFLVYLLTSREYFENTTNIARGTTMQRISRSALGRIHIPIPPLTEQQEITAQLKHITTNNRLASKTINQSINYLREFRSALITAAVTGQINVATWGKQGQTDRRLDRIEEAMQA